MRFLKVIIIYNNKTIVYFFIYGKYIYINFKNKNMYK